MNAYDWITAVALFLLAVLFISIVRSTRGD